MEWTLVGDAPAAYAMHSTNCLGLTCIAVAGLRVPLSAFLEWASYKFLNEWINTLMSFLKTFLKCRSGPMNISWRCRVPEVVAGAPECSEREVMFCFDVCFCVGPWKSLLEYVRSSDSCDKTEHWCHTTTPHLPLRRRPWAVVQHHSMLTVSHASAPRPLLQYGTVARWAILVISGTVARSGVWLRVGLLLGEPF